MALIAEVTTMINEAIFREYDIRGLAETELADPVVERIAMAAAAVYVREGKKEIAMGMDGRPSSPRIKDLFSRTLARYGLQVTDLGLVPTPVVYFAAFQHKMGGAVIITASHNPSEYNGFKILLGTAALYGEQIKEIYRLAVDGPFPAEKKGSIRKKDILPEYLALYRKQHQAEKEDPRGRRRRQRHRRHHRSRALPPPGRRGHPASSATWTAASPTTIPTPPWSRTCRT